MMKITIKRILGIIGLLMAIGFGVFVYGGWQMFGDELKAIKSLKMIKERVYTFEYRGDYGFKTQEEGIQALKEASYEEETLWSVIYDKEKLSSTIYFDRKWDEPLSFRIIDKDYGGHRLNQPKKVVRSSVPYSMATMSEL